MSHLILARHGETIWHAENRYAGHSDITLTANGEAQAERLGRWAASVELSAVWSSPLVRAQRTAGPAALAKGLPVQVDPRLIELAFGPCEGLTGEEMQARFPVERAAFLHNPVTHFLPGGEDPVAATARGVAALSAIAAAAPAGRSLVVAHSTLFRLVLCSLLQIPLERYRVAFPNLANGTITEIKMTPRGTSLLSYNVPLPA